VQIDAEHAALLFKNEVEKLGRTCWLDRYADDKTVKGMENGVKNCDCVIAFVTPNYLRRKICLMELAWAMKYGKRVQPVHLPADREKIGSMCSSAPKAFHWIFDRNLLPVQISDSRLLFSTLPIIIVDSERVAMPPPIPDGETACSFVDCAMLELDSMADGDSGENQTTAKVKIQTNYLIDREIPDLVSEYMTIDNWSRFCDRVDNTMNEIRILKSAMKIIGTIMSIATLLTIFGIFYEMFSNVDDYSAMDRDDDTSHDDGDSFIKQDAFFDKQHDGILDMKNEMTRYLKKQNEFFNQQDDFWNKTDDMEDDVWDHFCFEIVISFIYIIIVLFTRCYHGKKKKQSVEKIKGICNITTEEEARLTFSYEVCNHEEYIEYGPTFFDSDLHEPFIKHNHCKVYSRSETIGNGTMQYTFNPVIYPKNEAEHHCQLYTKEYSKEQFIRVSLKATDTSISPFEIA